MKRIYFDISATTPIDNKIADFIGFETNDFREILYHQGKLKPSLISKRGEIYN